MIGADQAFETQALLENSCVILRTCLVYPAGLFLRKDNMSITYFPMYPSDWRAGTSELSATEKGVYISLICKMYEVAGSIKRDDERLMRTCGCKSKTAFVKALTALIDQGKIECENGELSNERVQKEIKKLIQRSTQAKRAAELKWSQKSRKNKGQGDADASLEHMRKPCPDDAIQSQSQNHNHNQSITTNSTSKKSEPCAPNNGSNALTNPKSKYGEQFELWWKMYPNKQGKAEAQKKFRKMTDDQIDDLFTATRHYKQAIEHGVNSGLTCHGSTFINGRYLDWIESPTDELMSVSVPIETEKPQAGDKLRRHFEEQLAQKEAEAESGIIESHIVEDKTPLIGEQSAAGEITAQDVAEYERVKSSDIFQHFSNHNTNP